MRKQVVAAIVGGGMVLSTFSVSYGVELSHDERVGGESDHDTATQSSESSDAFTISAVAPNGRARIVCGGGFKGGRWYDFPHPGRSSNKRAINAHLSVDCKGPGSNATFVKVRSVMHSARRNGGPSFGQGMGGAKTGGDLRCVKKKRVYRARGFVRVKFPPGYKPPGGTRTPTSVARVFKKNRRTGKCVRP